MAINCNIVDKNVWNLCKAIARLQCPDKKMRSTAQKAMLL